MAKRSGNDVDRAVSAGNSNGRKVAGTSYAYSKVDDRSGKEFDKGQMVKRKDGKGGPEQATARHRPAVSQDRLGPRVAIAAKMPGPMAPEASATQSNTRFMRSVVNRSQPNFQLGRLG
jgi:hypothetical protein